MQKSMDTKLRRILEDPSCSDFILADAKDADLAFGLSSTGKSPEYHAHEARFRSLAEYRQIMRDVVRQGLVDIMLMSPSTSEILTIRERIFDGSHITPAVRANDTTDIWLASGTGQFGKQASQPFRSATIDHIMCGKVECAESERRLGADLGMYSITFNNEVDLDRASAEAYADFRFEAEKKGFRHFLEVFDPNACSNHCPADVARFVTDMTVRLLAGAVGKSRPLFLKIAYHGPEAMEKLAAYDRTLVPGIMGGSSGTTFDAFHMLWEAKKHGAKVALYGRKINHSEHQLTFIQYLRAIADGQISPADAVKGYHADLQKLGIAPFRSLENDLQKTISVAGYSASTGRIVATVQGGKSAAAAASEPVDASKLSNKEKIALTLGKWSRILGDVAPRKRN